MKRTLVATMVLGLLAAAAPAALTANVTVSDPSNPYEVHPGVFVDVYTISLDAGAGHLVGALLFNVGTMIIVDPNDPNTQPPDYPAPLEDPFQAGYEYYSPVPPPGGNVIATTPTSDDAGTWLSGQANLLAADSHFLPSGIAGWSPKIVDPNETNDGSIQDIVGDYYLGVGGMEVAVAVPVAYRTQTIDALQVGVIRDTTGVWVYNGSADELGNLVPDPNDRWIWLPSVPEPATLSLLALGGVALIRRRRA